MNEEAAVVEGASRVVTIHSRNLSTVLVFINLNEGLAIRAAFGYHVFEAQSVFTDDSSTSVELPNAQERVDEGTRVGRDARVALVVNSVHVSELGVSTVAASVACDRKVARVVERRSIIPVAVLDDPIVDRDVFQVVKLVGVNRYVLAFALLGRVEPVTRYRDHLTAELGADEGVNRLHC